MIRNQLSTSFKSQLKDYSSPETFAMALDEAMLSMILLLRHEPENLKSTLLNYERLYILKTIILAPETPHLS
ncbi:hypothetical protein [Sporocytophaga myxococcoides]|uniref:hypothetical protein n=1 Tax=Sporocytophaga myxococcoides TaxID=153721 RepID=UPI0005EFD143|nr:hypothetical protein [Sporocytophaga myxococcoides]